MKIISFYKLLLILITQAIHFSEQIKHINESSSIVACKGKDVDLLWKVDEEKYKISKLEWYFNNKMICTSSTDEAFTVEPPYQGRIERIGKTKIRLKNLSQDDEGIYILHPLFEWSIADNMLKIELRILEPPTRYCTCNIGYPPDFKFELTESYCGRPQVSLVWKRKQTYAVLGEGNHTLNSTLQDKEVLCCQDGEAMKCVDDNRQTEFCTTVSIPHRDNERSSEDGNTQRIGSVTMPGTDTGSTNIQHIQSFALVIMTVSLLTASLVLVLFICKIRKENKCVGKMRKNKKDSGGPRHEITSEDYEHQQSLLLEKMKKMLELHQAALFKICHVGPRHEITSEDYEHEHGRFLENMKEMLEHSRFWENMIEMLELYQAALFKICHVGPRHEVTSEDYEHQQSLFLENMKEMLELHQAALCKIWHVDENEYGL